MPQFPFSQHIDTAPPEPELLAWTQQDIENRLWFQGGRHTNVNHVLAFLIGIAVSITAYCILWLLADNLHRAEVVTQLYLRPNNQFTVVPATILFFSGTAILMLKALKLRYQQLALNLQAVPEEPDFVLNENTAATVLARIHSLVDHPRYFLLLNRIDRALSNLKNIGNINDVSAILRAQAENDEDQVASSYALLNGLVWAVPVLGFIGTVIGLSTAIGQFSFTLQSAADLSALRTSLQGVTGGLATAFETTLVALVYALILQLWITFQQRREVTFLDECNDYCHSHIVSKLRLLDRNVSQNV